jgi:hypothetical protein
MGITKVEEGVTLKEMRRPWIKSLVLTPTCPSTAMKAS